MHCFITQGPQGWAVSIWKGAAKIWSQGGIDSRFMAHCIAQAQMGKMKAEART